MGGALIGLFFFATLYLQQVLHYGPLTAGLAFLPLALTIGASAGIASQLSTKLGPKPVLVAASRSRPPACTGSATSPPTAASSATSCSRASSSPSAWAWRSCR